MTTERKPPGPTRRTRPPAGSRRAVGPGPRGAPRRSDLRAGLGLALVAGLLALAGRNHRPIPPPPDAPPVVVTGPTVPTPAPIFGPVAVSRAFVGAYVAFLYGRLPPSQLPFASPRLRRQAQAERPDPPAVVVAAADPRLRSLRLSPGRPTRARATAVIDDGPAVYEIHLDLRRLPSGWTVAGLTETG